MTPNYLKKMLPLLLDADPAQATNVRLVSLARAFVAGYELVSSVAPAGEFGTEETYRNRIDSLFWALSERSEHEPDTAIRSRMVHAMYSPAKRCFPSICGRKTVATGLRTHLSGILWASSVPDRKTVCFNRRASACARPTCSIPLRLSMTNTCCS